MSAGGRAALYTVDGSNLLSCASHAERIGVRVVTMIQEAANDASAPLASLGGARLTSLVDRLGNGEFEVIVADAGCGRLVTIGAVQGREAVP